MENLGEYTTTKGNRYFLSYHESAQKGLAGATPPGSGGGTPIEIPITRDKTTEEKRAILIKHLEEGNY